LPLALHGIAFPPCFRDFVDAFAIRQDGALAPRAAVAFDAALVRKT
jgi:hypothetical protein